MNQFRRCLTRSILLLAVAAIAACGGGNDSVDTPTIPAIKASFPVPAKKAATVAGASGVAIGMYQALYGMAPSNAMLLDYTAQATADASAFAQKLASNFNNTSHAVLAKQVLDNLGVTATTVPAVNAKGESEYTLLLDAVTQIFGVFHTMRGQVILNMTNLLAGLEGDGTYGATATAYKNQTAVNYAASSNGVPIAVANFPAALNGGMFVIDPLPSWSPLGKPLTFSWNVVSMPPTNPGVSYGDQNGRTGAYVNARFGDYVFSLTVSDGTLTSLPLTVKIKYCCDLKTPISTWSSYAATLPIYTQDYIRAKWDAEKTDLTSLKDYFRFAATYGLSAHHLDWLLGYAPLTIQGASNQQQYANVNFPPPNGGATISGFSESIPNVIQVDSDLSKVNYPADFSKARAATATVRDPFCSVNPAVISMQADDLGSYSLPQIKAQPLPSNSIKMADIKDIWTLVYPNTNCARDPAKVIDATLSRLAISGINAISITPWAIFNVSAAGAWSVIPAGDLDGSAMSDDDIGYIVTEAHKRGMAVYWRNQIQIVQRADQTQLQASGTVQSDVNSAIDAMGLYLQERASTLQRLGVDGIKIGPWYWVNFENYLDKTTFVSKFATLINGIKTRFSGKIVLDLDDGTADPALYSLADYYLFSRFPNYDSTSIANLSVADMTSQMKAAFAPYVVKLGNKPVILDVGPQSREGFYTTNLGYFDPFCTPVAGSPCPQMNMRGDYSAQAIWYEAELEAFVGSPGINLGGVSMPYIFFDNLLPSEWFPNIDATVRGKPAEYVLYKWFTAK